MTAGVGLTPSAALAQPAPEPGEDALGEAEESAAEAASPTDTPEAQTQSATVLPAPPTTVPTPAAPAAPAAPILIPDGAPPPGPVAPAFPPAVPNIDYGARMRIATKIQNATDPEKMNDLSQQADADIYMSGQIHRMFKWQAGVTISYTGALGASNAIQVQPLDLLARFEPLPEFNIYMGRMIVVADRFTPSGPWGMDEFFYPGLVGAPGVAAPALQKSGPTGRDLGINVWGAPMAGHIKYYLGVYQLHDPGINPLLSGRLQISLLNGEPAFYQRTTYFGTKDFVSLGGGAQYQKGGSARVIPAAGMMPMMVLSDDYSFYTFDLTMDKNIGDAGTISLYGAYMGWSGDYNAWSNYWFGSVGYLLPGVIGIGKIRFNVRYQRGTNETPVGSTVEPDASSILDFQVSYNIMPWFARVQVGFRRSEIYAFANPMTMAPARLQAGNQIYVGITLADP
ncbi:MAG TPA: hypothetical protein VJR89_03775 [Polyangiales bacterium]|nr:hypothetical protein [Polyangiales bacterium]